MISSADESLIVKCGLVRCIVLISICRPCAPRCEDVRCVVGSALIGPSTPVYRGVKLEIFQTSSSVEFEGLILFHLVDIIM